jgi:formamidopyrimidine-DNA glycosylase
MPELPEAETIVRGLRDPLVDSRIAGLRVIHSDVLDGDPGTVAETVKTRRITEVTRRGKNIVIHLAPPARLVVNLGMSGRLLHRSPDEQSPPPSHPALVFPLDPEGSLIYHDVRRFGRVQLLTPGEYEEWASRLGPEPLGSHFTSAALAEALSRSISPVRSWLLDQRKVAGIGNIYANEALHRARIHPRTPSAQIDPSAARRLHRSIRAVLREAVEARGTTLRDYRTAQGWEGSYAPRLRVYGRGGASCPRCPGTVQRIVFGNRSAFLCPRCQPEP